MKEDKPVKRKAKLIICTSATNSSVRANAMAQSLFKGHKNVQHPDGSTPDAWLNYTCAHCNTQVSGAVVARINYARHDDNAADVEWLLCTHCANGSVKVASGAIYPGVPFGPQIEGLPDDVHAAYNEARACLSANAFTACELMCRKILMHIAVDKGAKEGDSFSSYLDYLEKNGYITPPMKTWTALIKIHGNMATHRLATSDRKRAESTLTFTAELLRLVYEMAYQANKFTNPGKPTP